jgi:hypothetical protein
MTVYIGFPEAGLGVLLFAALQYLASLWIGERLKTSLQKEHSRFLENLKWELKVREQAVRVAILVSCHNSRRGFTRLRLSEGESTKLGVSYVATGRDI